jgi:hypothetical protein
VNFFDASATLRSPAGRTTARLQLEVKPLGQLLDGTSPLTGGWLDNVTFPRDASSFLGASNQPYTWRARCVARQPFSREPRAPGA